MATTTKNLGIVSPVPADEWKASTTYQKLNIVSHNNGSYIAKQGSTGIEPGVTINWQTYWMLLVSTTGGGGSGDFDPTKYYTKTETDGLLNEKQDDLTQTQLNAVNSGITATKVSTYDGYATAINNKVDKVTGKGLSTNDFTTAEKTKLAGIETGAEVNEIDTITAGSNVTVSKSGKTVTISATGGGGTTVVANPTLTGSETNLTALQVGATKYGIKALKVTIW